MDLSTEQLLRELKQRNNLNETELILMDRLEAALDEIDTLHAEMTAARVIAPLMVTA